eukprot:Nitzschia sp. Nitz4//scaffold61_size107673//48612//49274//NITZ4_004235-RA/size107673-processed-gene-0.186-mRNA-1//-1//CDS//3329555710//1201//frame0
MSFVPRIASRTFGSLCSKAKTAPLVRPEATCTTRLFGTKRGVPGNPPGDILYYNEQRDLKDIDEKAIRNTVDQIRKCVGYETYDVTLILCDDEEMQISNAESRGVDAPTDVLSFPFLDVIEPGLLEEPDFDVPDMYTLGDIMIDIPYVMRVCSEDAEYEPDPEDRGVSAIMAQETDPEKRIHMLLIHGMLHLVGYDHETDEEFEAMVAEEERILKELGYE